MRWDCFVILSALLVTKAAASCDKEDCETGLAVGVGVASVCSAVGAFLCAPTGGLGCVVSLACGVTAGVARAATEACRLCGSGGGGAGVNAESLGHQMKNLSLTADHVLEQILQLERKIQLTQILVLYGEDITNYQKIRGAFSRLSKNENGLIIRNLDKESFEKVANNANYGAAASSIQMFKMMTGGHPLKKESIFQAFPESCQNRAKDYFIQMMLDCFLLESVARAMRGESIHPAREQEFKKQLVLIEDQFTKDCGCPEPLVKTTRHPGLLSTLASLNSSIPAGNCTSQVTYPGQSILSFIMDDSIDRLTLKKIALLYSVAPFTAAKSAAAKATAEKYWMEEMQLAQYLSLSGSLADITLYENSLFCSSGVFKLHSDSGFAYYKIAVDSGVRMVEGATSTACRKMGMESSCLGPRGCRYNDESRTGSHPGDLGCQVTPLEAVCGSTMMGISQAVCNGETNPRMCPKLEGVFLHRKFSEGDLGMIGGTFVSGQDYTSGDGGKTLFAYCSLML